MKPDCLVPCTVKPVRVVSNCMGEDTSARDRLVTAERTVADETTTTEQLRAISFRLREIQRLQAIRVEQVNRRLEADGIEPVTEADFFRSKAEQED